MLLVQWAQETVGYLTPQRRGRVQFTYAPEWIEKYNQSISLSLPCTLERFDAQTSTAFFDNLLPEGTAYKELCLENRIDETDTYRFLQFFGQDCAGALTVVSEDAPEVLVKPAYRDITNKLEEILASNRGMPTNSLIAETKARLSIAGAQNKLPIRLQDGKFFVPEEGSHAPTTAILKPTTTRFQDIHYNEVFCMELARKTGLQTPDVMLVQIGDFQAYVTMRYDRQQTDVGILRLHQEDFCQALRYSRLVKYEEHGGPSFSSCNKVLLNPLVTESVAARENFIKCALFNYIIGNCDAHAKNFSLLYHRGEGVCLAPFYDLVSTMVYPDLEQKFAMAFGKTFRFDRISTHSWKQFAADMSIRMEQLGLLAEEVANSVAACVDTLIEEHQRKYGTLPLYDSLMRIIRNGIALIRQI
jgi:serine/threonine-protein kinase HipA